MASFKEINNENDICLSVNKNDSELIKEKLKCGAFIVEETETQYLMKIKSDNSIHFGFRNLRRDDWKRILQKEVYIEDVSNAYFEGKVGFLKMVEVESPLQVESPIGKVTIADNNYKNLIFAPRNKNWWLTIMYDNQNNIIESYFDITKTNNFENEDNPFFVDMKLDVCIPFNGEPVIMDSNELKEILDKELINKEDYEMAYNVASEIIENYKNNKDKYYRYIATYFNKFNSK